VRYLAAVALGASRLANSRRIVKDLRPALHDRNLRVQSAARYAVQRLSARTAAAGHHSEAVKRSPASSRGAAAAGLAAGADDARVHVRLADASPADEPRAAAQPGPTAFAQEQGDVEAPFAATEESPESTAAAEPEIPAPPQVELAQSDAGAPAAAAPAYVHDEGLKAISEVGASIRVPEGDLPEDVAAQRMAAAGAFYHGYGARRGWSNVAFGWDAPAVAFKPIYFQDVNLERYGRHFGCYQPFVSWGMFYYDCLLLPYKLVAQPPCECKYTLGYDRPNNCIPLQCCRMGCPSLSKLYLNPWNAACCTCPIHPADPWRCHEED
jgi:hypothetical protein